MRHQSNDVDNRLAQRAQVLRVRPDNSETVFPVLSPGLKAVVVVEHCTVSPCAHQGSTRVGNQILWCIIFTAEKLLEI